MTMNPPTLEERVYYLKASDEKDMLTWIRLIKERIQILSDKNAQV
jgi:hypothetical protein